MLIPLISGSNSIVYVEKMVKCDGLKLLLMAHDIRIFFFGIMALVGVFFGY